MKNSKSEITDVKEEKEEKAITAVNNMHHDKKLLACQDCGKEYPTRITLMSHIHSHISTDPVTKSKPHKCIICHETFRLKFCLMLHLQSHTIIDQTKKNKIGIIDVQGKEETESTLNNVKVEPTVNLENVAPHQCLICGKSFKVARYLNDHKKIHTGKKFSCQYCSKGFTRSDDLTAHVRTHTGEKPYQCNICLKCFSQKSHLKTHHVIHTGEKPYKCNICHKTFSASCSLKCHLFTHGGEKPHKCNVCNKTFTLKGYLKNHLVLHTGEKPYKCNVCHKTFALKNTLRGHLFVHTGQRKHKCDYCNKTFLKMASLNVHLSIHTKEECKKEIKKKTCHVCNKSFTVNGLQGHLLVHLKQKPYKCSTCHASFYYVKTLTTHIRDYHRTNFKPHEISIQNTVSRNVCNDIEEGTGECVSYDTKIISENTDGTDIQKTITEWDQQSEKVDCETKRNMNYNGELICSIYDVNVKEQKPVLDKIEEAEIEIITTVKTETEEESADNTKEPQIKIIDNIKEEPGDTF